MADKGAADGRDTFFNPVLFETDRHATSRASRELYVVNKRRNLWGLAVGVSYHKRTPVESLHDEGHFQKGVSAQHGYRPVRAQSDLEASCAISFFSAKLRPTRAT